MNEQVCPKCGHEVFHESIPALLAGRHHINDKETCLSNQLDRALNQLAAVTAERDQLQQRVAELEEVAKVALKSLDDCTLDIALWVQLAKYQREQSEDPSRDPKCATERAIIVSEERVADAYCAADAIRSIGDANQ